MKINMIGIGHETVASISIAFSISMKYLWFKKQNKKPSHYVIGYLYSNLGVPSHIYKIHVHFDWIFFYLKDMSLIIANL